MAYDADINVAIMETFEKASNSAFLYVSPTGANPSIWSVKCAEITDINAFACLNYNRDNYYITKLDRLANTNYLLVPFLTEKEDAKFKMEDMFYNRARG